MLFLLYQRFELWFHWNEIFIVFILDEFHVKQHLLERYEMIWYRIFLKKNVKKSFSISKKGDVISQLTLTSHSFEYKKHRNKR